MKTTNQIIDIINPIIITTCQKFFPNVCIGYEEHNMDQILNIELLECHDGIECSQLQYRMSITTCSQISNDYYKKLAELQHDIKLLMHNIECILDSKIVSSITSKRDAKYNYNSSFITQIIIPKDIKD